MCQRPGVRPGGSSSGPTSKRDRTDRLRRAAVLSVRDWQGHSTYSLAEQRTRQMESQPIDRRPRRHEAKRATVSQGIGTRSATATQYAASIFNHVGALLDPSSPPDIPEQVTHLPS